MVASPKVNADAYDKDVTFGPTLHASGSRLSILISSLHFSIPVTIYIDACDGPYNSGLIRAYPSSLTPAVLQQLLSLLRRTYPPSSPPPFGTVPFLTPGRDGILRVAARADPRLETQSLAALTKSYPAATKLPRVRCSRLRPRMLAPGAPKSWSSQIQLIRVKTRCRKRTAVAKGLSAELGVLLGLPRHDGMIPPPTALVTDGEGTNERVLGFLLEWYPLGSLDKYVESVGGTGAAEVTEWGRQIAVALDWLHSQAKSWHCDVKPDNVLVECTDPWRLRLCDFAQDAFTAATCPPEIRGGWIVDANAGSRGGGSFTGYRLPEFEGYSTPDVVATWPPAARELAESYGLGRTIQILARGETMTDLYMRLFEDVEYYYDPAWAEDEVMDEAWEKVRTVVENATKLDPGTRWRLGKCAAVFEESRGSVVRGSTGDDDDEWVKVDDDKTKKEGKKKMDICNIM